MVYSRVIKPKLLPILNPILPGPFPAVIGPLPPFKYAIKPLEPALALSFITPGKVLINAVDKLLVLKNDTGEPPGALLI